MPIIEDIPIIAIFFYIFICFYLIYLIITDKKHYVITKIFLISVAFAKPILLSVYVLYRLFRKLNEKEIVPKDEYIKLKINTENININSFQENAKKYKEEIKPLKKNINISSFQENAEKYKEEVKPQKEDIKENKYYKHLEKNLNKSLNK